MLTCKEASHLASKAMDAKLTWRERLGLWLHVSMCGLCRRYVSDMKKLRLMMIKVRKSGRELLPKSVKLSAQSRDRIKKAINRASNRPE